jgi:hypothetical protein
MKPPFWKMMSASRLSTGRDSVSRASSCRDCHSNFLSAPALTRR